MGGLAPAWGAVNELMDDVAAGFMPAFKYLHKISFVELERGHKARGYKV